MYISLALLYSWLHCVCLISAQNPQGQEPPFFIYGDGPSLMRMGLTGTQKQYVSRFIQDITDLDFDYISGYIYWTNQAKNVIQRIHLENADGAAQDFPLPNIRQPTGIAIDWLNRKLFWTDTVNKNIESVALNRTQRKLLVSNLHEPHNIVLDPMNDLMYWIDRGLVRPSFVRGSDGGMMVREMYEGVKIERSRMRDGTERVAIVTTDLQRPSALAIDYHQQMLYWADIGRNVIEVSSLSGTNRRQLIKSSFGFMFGGAVRAPAGLTTYGDNIYWTEPGLKKVFLANKLTGEGATELPGNYINPHAIHVYHPTRQPGVSRCPTGWVYFGFHCYKFISNELLTFHDALAMCYNKHKATLVAINSREEQTFIAYQLRSHNPSHWWTSGTRTHPGRTWVWTAGNQPITFSAWKEIGPEEGFKDYLALEKQPDNTYPWVAMDNDRSFPYICEMSFATQMKCPSGMLQSTSSCYELHATQPLNWREAMSTCQTSGGHLVYIDDQTEDSFIQNLSRNSTSVWLGVSVCTNLPRWLKIPERALLNAAGQVNTYPNTATVQQCQQYCIANRNFTCTTINYAARSPSRVCHVMSLSPNSPGSQLANITVFDIYTRNTSAEVRWSNGGVVEFSRWRSPPASVFKNTSQPAVHCCAQREHSPGANSWVFKPCLSTSHFICEYPVEQICIGNGGKGPCEHACINNQCVCPYGMALKPDGVTCEGSNPCAVANGGCGTALCVMQGSRHYCRCPLGFQFLTQNTTCLDIDECATGNPCPGNCENTMGSFRCVCDEGFVYNVEIRQCQKVNICLTGKANCSHRCIDMGTTFVCDCYPGFRTGRDNTSCIDIDECMLHPSPCEGGCLNVPGTYFCTCAPGYTMTSDRKTCERIKCSPPPPIQNPRVVCQQQKQHYFFQDKCRVICDTGTLVGPEEIRCEATGMWSQPPRCVPTPLPTPPLPNRAPTMMGLSSTRIPEKSDPGTLVGWLRTVDPDQGQTFTYTLHNFGNVFEIVPENDQAKLVVKGSLDYESVKSYSLNITSRDSGQPPKSITKTLTVDILDMNEPPYPPVISNNRVAENATVGTVVGHLFSRDQDEGQQLYFSLRDDGSSHFSVVNNLLMVAKPLNYEQNASYQLDVLANDNGHPPLSTQQIIPIQVLDVNEKPTGITLEKSAVKEFVLGNSSIANGTVIGQLLAVDEDKEDSHIFRLQGSQQWPFHDCLAINNKQQLVVGNTRCFDHELWPVLVVSVAVIDRSGLLFEQNLTITVEDVNEAPTSITLSPSYVFENAPNGTVVGTISVTDPDGNNNHVIMATRPDTWFRIDGRVLKVRWERNYETASTVPIILRATDSGGLWVEQTIVVTVRDVQEAPRLRFSPVHKFSCPAGNVNELCIPEDVQENTSVEGISAYDEDGDHVNITLTDVTGHFIIHDNNLILKHRLDYEGNDPNPLVLHVLATDSAGSRASMFVKVFTQDANDPPTAVSLSNTILPDNVNAGYVVGTLSCWDQDTNDNHTFSIEGDDLRYPFVIEGSFLKVTRPFSNTSFGITIRCSDGAVESPPSKGLMRLLHLSESAKTSVIILTSHTVAENQPAGTLVGVLQVTSQTNAHFNVSFIEGTGEGFRLEILPGNKANLLTTRPLDYEDQTSHPLVIRAAASDDVITYKRINIVVLNEVEPPSDIILDSQEIVEGLAGRVVGFAYLKGAERGSSFDWKIQPDSNVFQIKSNGALGAKLETKADIDYESFNGEALYNLTLVVQDKSNSNSVLSKTFTIKVLDKNEGPMAIHLPQSSIQENTVAGSPVGPLVVDDPDEMEQSIGCQVIEDVMGWFTVGAATKLLVAPGAKIDFEDASLGSDHQLPVTVQCWDKGGFSVTETLYVTVKDMNEPPTDIVSRTGEFSIVENQDSGAVVAILNSVDPDVNDNATFQILNTRTFESSFHMNQNQLVSHKRLNYEQQQMYTVMISVTDKGKLNFTKLIQIEVKDQNDPPTAIHIPQNASVPENSPTGYLVTTLSTVDEDLSQQHRYTIHSQSPDGALTIVNGNQLVVANGSAIDYETSRHIDVTIESRDSGNPPLSHIQVVRIAIIDQNEPPSNIVLNNTKILENSHPGKLVANIEVSDPDTFPQIFSCGFVGDVGNSFKVMNDMRSSSNTITLVVNNASSINFETAPSHYITLKCADNLGLSVQRGFQITVEDRNDAPSSILVYKVEGKKTLHDAPPPPPPSKATSRSMSLWVQNGVSFINESLESSVDGTQVVAYLFVRDEDNAMFPHQTHSCHFITQRDYITNLNVSPPNPELTKLLRDDLPTSFRIMSIHGSPVLALVIVRPLDFESTSYHNLYIRCYDNAYPHPLSVDGNFDVAVQNLAEPPLKITMESIEVRENSPANTLIGNFSVLDTDGGGRYSLSIESKNVPLYVKGMSVYTATAQLDYEKTPEIEFDVKITKIGTSFSLNQTFKIQVTDTPEPPCCLSFAGSVEKDISTQTAVGTVIGTMTAKDDMGDSQTYKLKAALYNREDLTGYFTIQDNSVILAKALDDKVALGGLIRLEILVTDNTNRTLNSSVYVRLMQANCGRELCPQHSYCVLPPTGVPQCRCKNGYDQVGNRCVKRDYCHRKPCSEVGTNQCINSADHFMCQCRTGFDGAYCERQLSSGRLNCWNVTCNRQGTRMCGESSAASPCQCKVGYFGDQCVSKPSGCRLRPCHNNATCVDTVECFSNGTCTRTGMIDYRCECTAGFTGIHCDIDRTACGKVTCPYSGTCIPVSYAMGSNYICRCSKPFKKDCSGCMFDYRGPSCTPCGPSDRDENCDVKTPRQCQPGFCAKNITCVVLSTGEQLCVCPPGRNGTRCEDNVITNVVIAKKQDSGRDFGWVPWVVGVLLAVMALVAIILLIVYAVYRQRRRRLKPIIKPVRKANGVDGTVIASQGSAEVVGQFDNPIYESAPVLISSNGNRPAPVEGAVCANQNRCNNHTEPVTGKEKAAALPEKDLGVVPEEMEEELDTPDTEEDLSPSEERAVLSSNEKTVAAERDAGTGDKDEIHEETDDEDDDELEPAWINNNDNGHRENNKTSSEVTYRNDSLPGDTK